MALNLPWRNILSGAVFGTALTAAGMYSPSTIIGQMNLTNFHMMKGFLAASASSAIFIALTNFLSLTTCKPRTPATSALPGIYTANILGGAFLGLGMTLTGACPGTVFSQVATGMASGIPVLIGTGIGGIIYSFLKPRMAASSAIVQKKKGAPSFTKPTVPDRAGLSNLTGLALYEIILVGLVAGAVHFFPRNSPSLVDPVLGGFLVGISQLTSLLLTSSTLGISTAFEQVGDFFWWLLNPSKPCPSIKGTAFATGTLAGAYILTLVAAVPMLDETITIGTTRAICGGAILVVGSRIAGGCTSGHGISGMSMLSVSSFLTVGGMFAGGIGSAALFRSIGW